MDHEFIKESISYFNGITLAKFMKSAKCEIKLMISST